MPDALPPRGHVCHLSRQTQPGTSLSAHTYVGPWCNRKSRQDPGQPRMHPGIRDRPAITCLEHIEDNTASPTERPWHQRPSEWWYYP